MSILLWCVGNRYVQGQNHVKKKSTGRWVHQLIAKVNISLHKMIENVLSEEHWKEKCC